MSVDGQQIASSQDEIRALTAKIVSAHVGNNSVAIGDLPSLIVQVHGALSGLDKPIEPVVERPQPAVPVKKSVTAEYLICLEDGKKLKMLKRHLSSAYNLGSDAVLMELGYVAPMTRAWSRSILPRPYIWRFTSLSLVI